MPYPVISKRYQRARPISNFRLSDNELWDYYGRKGSWLTIRLYEILHSMISGMYQRSRPKSNFRLSDNELWDYYGRRGSWLTNESL